MARDERRETTIVKIVVYFVGNAIIFTLGFEKCQSQVAQEVYNVYTYMYMKISSWCTGNPWITHQLKSTFLPIIERPLQVVKTVFAHAPYPDDTVKSPPKQPTQSSQIIRVSVFVRLSRGVSKVIKYTSCIRR